jgi:ribbon-helix-helix CopG family protein
VKSIHVTFDESLLRELDSDAEVKHRGRSEVLRRAVMHYLQRRVSDRIAESYRRGYGASRIVGELQGWESQGVWSPGETHRGRRLSKKPGALPRSRRA